MTDNGKRTAAAADDVKQMIDDIDAFQSAPIGSCDFKALGQRIDWNMTENLLFAGALPVRR